MRWSSTMCWIGFSCVWVFHSLSVSLSLSLKRTQSPTHTHTWGLCRYFSLCLSVSTELMVASVFMKWSIPGHSEWKFGTFCPEMTHDLWICRFRGYSWNHEHQFESIFVKKGKGFNSDRDSNLQLLSKLCSVPLRCLVSRTLAKTVIKYFRRWQ